tara:strand:+ start:211 stop:1038 length:828 start_codon:yes stop_codon:yes gene_type:complete
MVNFFYLDKDPKKCAEYYCNKHVNKIMIEICQLLCNVIYYKTRLKPPYKKSNNIHPTLAPFRWAEKSLGNYKYLIELAENLLNEFKFRFNRDEHKSEKVIIWLKNHIPKNFKHKRRTKLLYTNNISLYHKYYNNDIECFRFIYVSYKCKNDKWTKRLKPEWFNQYLDYSIKEKLKYKKILENNVKIILPNKYKNDKDVKVKRFHSFLRIIYDNLFNEKWINFIKKYKNMYDPKKPLINQLSFVYLKEAVKLSKDLMIKKQLLLLNNKSLKFRNKK